MKSEAIIGWDVGGAHLKMAHINMNGKIISACQFPAPIWQGLHILDDALNHAKKYYVDGPCRHVITTTAELSDIFRDRHSGIDELVRSLSENLDKEHIRFYGGQAGWISADRTAQFVNEIASANWHATASYIAERVDAGILVDIGSTTTDIIPFTEGKLVNRGYTDFERLSSRELVYTGIIRTPVMAVTKQVLLNDTMRPLVAEHFATMADVYRLTGELQEQDDMMTTSDGAGKTRADSLRRLARMFALDIDGTEDIDIWIRAAQYIADVQFDNIRQAFQLVRSNMNAVTEPLIVGAGAGRFIADRLASQSGCRYLDFADLLDATPEIKPDAARSAAAVAVAQLARLSL